MPTNLSAFISSSYQGAQGIQGVQGTTGSQGIQGRQGLQGFSSINAWVTKTANYTAVNGDRIIANTSGGSFTITLPTAPTLGTSILINDGANWSTNNLIIARNGSTIEGLSENLTVDIGNIQLELVYSGSTWEVFSSISPNSVAGPSIVYSLVF
jgi:hypothetical protein